MKELVEDALDTAKRVGASYTDVRYILKTTEQISVKNGRIEVLKRDQDQGIGVRTIANGCWGFAATSELTRANVQRIAKLAVKIAKSSLRLKKRDVELAPTNIIRANYTTPVEIDPFKVPFEEKIDLLMRADEEIRRNKKIKISRANMRVWRKNQIFASSEGSYIEQEITAGGGSIEATAVKDGETGERSFPGMRGHYKTKGYEFIKSLGFVENAERIAEEAVALLKAKECPEETTTVICDGSMVAIQVHETVGHPTEMDRVLGTEVSLAGTSHLTPDKLKKFQFGTPTVNITADATILGGLGSFGYDDEGTKAQRTYLIKEGIFTGYLTSRETALVLNQRSNGTMRANSWGAIPLIRMTNINLEPGDGKLEDIIADTRDGIYFVSPTSPSIDEKRLNYHIGAEIGWRIKNGRLTEMIKRPSYTGISYEIWRNCDAICGKENWDVWGIPNCGKGDPMQTIYVGHGTAPARFRNVKVGGR